jgi:hypothetical protein
MEVIMRNFLACIGLFLIPLVAPSTLFPDQAQPIPPGRIEAEKQTNAPMEAPVPPRAKTIDMQRVQQEANELAQLSSSIAAQIQQVNKGQIPKDLGDQLKHIEKLAKHIRGEIFP